MLHVCVCVFRVGPLLRAPNGVGCVTKIIFDSFSAFAVDDELGPSPGWKSQLVTFSVYCLHTGLLVWLRLLWGSNGCFLPPVFQCLTQTCTKLAFSCTPVFSLFLTPMFVLLQDSVPMASPAFLLSLFVSIQGLPPISPEPGNAPYTLVSTQTHMRHTLNVCFYLSPPFAHWGSISRNKVKSENVIYERHWKFRPR